eukprot:978948-Rhodomonas_salina.1
MGLVGKVPLAPSVVVAPVVAKAGEVDPLGVPELVAHEGEVPLAAERHRDHADHLRRARVSDARGGATSWTERGD